MKFSNLFKKKKDARIVKMSEDLKSIVKKAIDEDKFSILEYSYIKEIMDRVEELNEYERYKFFYDMVKDWNSVYNISRESGEYLNELINQEDSIVAVHRTYVGPVSENPVDNTMISSIITNGLINPSHTSYGGNVENPDLSLVVLPVNSFEGVLLFVDDYKYNNVNIILQFPKSEVDDQLGFINEDSIDKIYYKDNGKCIIKPEYIMGVVVK